MRDFCRSPVLTPVSGERRTQSVDVLRPIIIYLSKATTSTDAWRKRPGAFKRNWHASVNTAAMIVTTATKTKYITTVLTSTTMTTPFHSYDDDGQNSWRGTPFRRSNCRVAQSINCESFPLKRRSRTLVI